MVLQRSPGSSTGQNKQVITRSTSRTSTEMCRICKKECTQNEMKVSCNGCKKYHHINCAGISTHFYQYYIEAKKIKWHCYICEHEVGTDNTECINKIHKLVINAG